MKLISGINLDKCFLGDGAWSSVLNCSVNYELVANVSKIHGLFIVAVQDLCVV